MVDSRFLRQAPRYFVTLLMVAPWQLLATTKLHILFYPIVVASVRACPDVERARLATNVHTTILSSAGGAARVVRIPQK